MPGSRSLMGYCSAIFGFGGLVRQDANRIGFTAIKGILSGASAFEVLVGATTVTCAATASAASVWPRSEGVDGLDEQGDGPWPGAVKVTCSWVDGACSLVADCSYLRTQGKNRHFVGLRVQTEAGQDLVWITVPSLIDDAADGSRVTIQGRMSSRRRADPDEP